MSTSIFRSIIDTYSPMLNEILAGCKNYQPHDPFYAFKEMDKAVSEGIKPVCVILGQDPYPQPGVPTGIAFANPITFILAQGKPSPSLAVILSSLRRLHYEKEEKPLQGLSKIKFDVSLIPWIKQGILPLNSALTVEPDRPGSHALMWAAPMRDMIKQITEVYPDLCWIILGSQAAIYSKILPASSFKLFDNHPSWYARNNTDMPVRVWKEAEDYCKKHFGKEIHWLG